MSTETIEIGAWVRREKRTHYHLVESTTVEYAFTKCGRRMDWHVPNGGGLVAGEYSDAAVGCIYCFGRNP